MVLKKMSAIVLSVVVTITTCGLSNVRALAPVNHALSAIATANSEYSSDYNANGAKELLAGGDWATYGGQVGMNTPASLSAPSINGKVTFTYTWSTPVSIGSIKLANRGNGENISNAKLYVNDVDTGMEIIKISNDAYSPTIVSLGQIRTNVTKLQLVVLSGGGNYGLQGFEVYEELQGNSSYLAAVTRSSEYPGSEYYAVNARAIGGNQVWASYGQPLPWIQYNFTNGIKIGHLRILGRSGEYITKAKIIVNGDVSNPYIIQGINGTEVVDYYLPTQMDNVTTIKLEAIESVGNNVGLQGFEVYSDWKEISSTKLWEAKVSTAYDYSAIPSTITQPNPKSMATTINDQQGIGGWLIIDSLSALDFTSVKSTAKLRFYAKASAQSALMFAVNNQNGNSYTVIQKDVTTSWQEYIIPLSDLVSVAPLGDETNNSLMKQIRITGTQGLVPGDILYLSSFELWSGSPVSDPVPSSTKIWSSTTNANGFGAINGSVASAKIVHETDYRFENAVRITSLTDGGLSDGCYIGDYNGEWNNIDISSIKDTGYIRFFAKASVPIIQDFYSYDNALTDYGNVTTISLTADWKEYIYKISDLRNNSNPFSYFVFRNNGENQLKTNQSIFISNIEVWTQSPDAIAPEKSGRVWKTNGFVNNFGTVGDLAGYPSTGSVVSIEEPFGTATKFTAKDNTSGLGSMMFLRNTVGNQSISAQITEKIKNNGYVRFYAKASKDIRIKINTSYGALSVYSPSKVLNVNNTWQEYKIRISDIFPLDANVNNKKTIDTIWLGHYDWSDDSSISQLDKSNINLLSQGETLEISPVEIFSENPVSTYTFGDVDGNGRVSIVDLLIVKKHILNLHQILGVKFIDSDFDKDNQITILELAKLKSMLLNPFTITIPNWHPGAIGYDVAYDINVVKSGKLLQNTGEYLITAITEGLTIADNKITIPYNVRKNLNECTIKVSLISNPEINTFYKIPLHTDLQVTFEDEFDGTTLDSSKWVPYMNNIPFGTNSTQVIGHQNAVSVNNGILSLNAKKETVVVGDKTYNYITGMIQTGPSGFEQNQGTFTGRFRFPTKGGINSAFWLTPKDYSNDFLFVDKSGAGCNEIDVFEQSANFENLGLSYSSGQHYFTKDAQNQNVFSHTNSRFSSSGDGSEIDIGWHDFCLVWTDTATYYYCDGHLIQMIDGLSNSTTLNNKAHMILTAGVASINNDISGNWYGSMNDSDFPQSFEVDYIKVYK